MNNKMAISETIDRIKSTLERYSDIAAVYLLGSIVSGELREDSDIDMALMPEANRTISTRIRLELASLLEAELGRTVDVGVITPANLVYASEVFLTGRRIATINPEYADAMEDRLLGSYLLFRQDRRQLEEAYSAA